jgi:hypothetical protein
MVLGKTFVGERTHISDTALEQREPCSSYVDPNRVYWETRSIMLSCDDVFENTRSERWQRQKK